MAADKTPSRRPWLLPTIVVVAVVVLVAAIVYVVATGQKFF